MTTASGDAVDGTQVAGQTSVNGGTNHQNGAVATLADDIASINAATQNALTIPVGRGTRQGKWGRMTGTGLNGQALPGNKEGGY